MARLSAGLAATVLSVALTGPVAAQLSNANERTPDAGNPAVELNPPGVIAPMSGQGLQPIGPGYLGGPLTGSPPSGRTFQSTPGFLPRPRDDINRAFDSDKKEQRNFNGVVVSLPPASTGRQGLPPQTWALLTTHQQDLHRQAETAAMSSVLGEGFQWTDDGRSGEVRVMADRIFNNRPCRDFVHAVTINGQTVTGQTTMCR
jgi:surface antigen